MSYHPRIETAEMASFLTTRSRNSELWFANNPALERVTLGYAAKYAQRHEVILYALAIEGNHIQGPAKFPLCNRAAFMRDFSSTVARAVPRVTPNYPGGRFWGRRYSAEFLPAPEDIERQFFYTVLQPVQDGLCPKISEYKGYNCFYDAVRGITRKFKVVRWGEYHAAKRHNPSTSIKDYTDFHELTYERLPGYEQLSRNEYVQLMQRKLEEHRQEVLAERARLGLGFATPEWLASVRPGDKPRKTKTSHRDSFRPRFICVCPERRRQVKAWYFSIYFAYKDASRRYRLGFIDAEFPPGTYKPPPLMVAVQ